MRSAPAGSHSTASLDHEAALCPSHLTFKSEAASELHSSRLVTPFEPNEKTISMA
jgi:hypothetical protein